MLKKDLKLNRIQPRDLLNIDLALLKPKVNLFLNSAKGRTHRDYIKKTKLKIKINKSPLSSNRPQDLNLRSRLVVVGSKEKIETPKTKSESKQSNLYQIARYSSRPCTCSPSKYSKPARGTLTIRMPYKPKDFDSDTDSNYCNYYGDSHRFLGY